jgi:hypothetical protein
MLSSILQHDFFYYWFVVRNGLTTSIRLANGCGSVGRGPGNAQDVAVSFNHDIDFCIIF